MSTGAKANPLKSLLTVSPWSPLPCPIEKTSWMQLPPLHPYRSEHCRRLQHEDSLPALQQPSAILTVRSARLQSDESVHYENAALKEVLAASECVRTWGPRKGWQLRTVESAKSLRRDDLQALHVENSSKRWPWKPRWEWPAIRAVVSVGHLVEQMVGGYRDGRIWNLILCTRRVMRDYIGMFNIEEN